MPWLADKPFKRIGLIGLGLIGGSFALAAKARWPEVELHAYDPSDAARAWATANRSVVLAESIEQLAAVSELIVIAAPLEQFPHIMGSIATSAGDETVVIDLASTKASATGEAGRSLGAVLPRFVGCHPIAGSEQSGAINAVANLFHDKPVVLTPDTNTSADALVQVELLWRLLGARPVMMEARQHDEVFAYLSHAPHALAFAYMLHAKPLGADALALAGSGFRDFTRIAASSPELWADILLDNRAAVIEVLKQQREAIGQMTELLTNQQRMPLVEALRMARDRRASVA